ncbi:hypothetical protein ANANG_G00230600 [Anguilla anguilla]|uniref:Uncharacterized protein n=1 Tax=Anguilla anguilla TaxID=7936 RepID=A0A9D3LTC1_ANGAN|nr:hypothetical protein ANANG_G00230600 [Anguilla anguilla]
MKYFISQFKLQVKLNNHQENNCFLESLVTSISRILCFTKLNHNGKAMDAAFATPHWLTKAKEAVENSKEWKCFTAELFEVLRQQLAESSVSMFSDLCEAEKALLVERAAKAVCAGRPHADVVAHISAVLEDALSYHVATEMQERHTVPSKTDLFQSHARNGMVYLLNKWPDMKSKLTILFNHPLPMELREVAWKLYLSNTKAQLDYLMAASVNQERSKRDLDICLQCDSLFSTGPMFHNLSNNELAIKVMKKVLSYYHRVQQLKSALPEADCLLLVPLLEVALARSSPSTSAHSVATLLVQQYLTFMNSRPGTCSGTESGDTFEEVASMLNQKDKELACVIRRVNSPKDGQIKDPLLKGVKEILQPIIQVFFVGYLDLPALLYVWDQYIIGLDSPLYKCLPAFAFAFLVLLREHFQGCSTSSEMTEVTRSQGHKLSVAQLQNIINIFFYEDLFSKLTQDKVQCFPVLDPTQAFLPPWTNLLSSKLTMRTKPCDRRQAREIREAQSAAETERKKQAQHQKLMEEAEIRIEQLRLQRDLEETRRISREQRAHLEEQLAQERQRHYETEKTAKERIDQLQAEARSIQEHKPLIKETEGSFGTPPPLTECQIDAQDSYGPVPEHHRTPPPTADAKDIASSQKDTLTINRTVEGVAADLLKSLVQSAGTRF